MMAGHISVPFFPTLQSFELEKLIDFGEVKLLFAGKLENWEEQSKVLKIFQLFLSHITIIIRYK